jgi:hypothetical protein
MSTARGAFHTGVCFGSKADVTLLNFDVCFTPESGHCRARLGCPLCARTGHQEATANALGGGTPRRVRLLHSLSTASRTRGLMVEPRHDRIGGALAILPRSANCAPQGLVDSFTGKPDDLV